MVQSSLPLRHILFCFALIQGLGVMAGTWLIREGIAERSNLGILLFVTQACIPAILILMVEQASKRRIQAYFERLDQRDPVYFFKYRIRRRDNGESVSSREMARLVARVNAEIRVTDVCFIQWPDTIFVTLRTMPEPLKGISSRIDSVFHNRKELDVQVLERGEIEKTSKSEILPQALLAAG